jgi:hypothetical protein
MVSLPPIGKVKAAYRITLEANRLEGGTGTTGHGSEAASQSSL